MHWPRETDHLNSSFHISQNSAPKLPSHRIGLYPVSLIISLGFVLLCVGLYYLRNQAIATAVKITQSMAYAVQEQTNSTLQAIDQRLQFAAISLQALEADHKLNKLTARAMLQEHLKELAFLRELQVLDLDGNVIFDSQSSDFVETQREKEHFQIYRRQPATEFHLSAPIKSPLTSTWTIKTSRPLRNSQGAVVGVIVADISLPHFEHLWQDLDLGHNSAVALWRSDGVLMFRSPGNNVAMGKPLGTYGPVLLFSQYLPLSPHGSYESKSVIDHVVRYNTYRTLTAYPQLIVIVGRSKDAVLASWWDFAKLTTLIWLLAIMAVLILSFLVWRTAQERLSTEVRFFQLAQSMPQIVFITATSGKLLFVSQQWYDMTGQQIEIAKKGAWLDMLHPEDRSGVVSHIQHILKSGEAVPYEYRVRCIDGSYRWQLARGTANRDSTGRIVSWFGTATDVEDLKQIHTKLLSQTRLLHTASTLSMLGGWSLDIATMQVNWSDETSALLGLPAGSSPSLETGLDMCHPQWRDLKLQAWMNCMNNGTPFDLELKMISYTGKHIWIRSIGQAVTDAKGTVTRVEGAFMDITKRKHNELALIESELRFGALFDAAPVSMWVINKTYDSILSTNEAAVQIYGYSRDDLKRLRPIDLLAPCDRARMQRLMRTNVPMNTQELWTHQRKDGSEFPVELIRRVIRHGEHEEVIVVSSDITARVQAEQRVLAQLQTLQRTTEAAVAITGHQTLPTMIQEIAERARTVIGAQLSVIYLSADNHRVQAIRAVSLSRQYERSCTKNLNAPDSLAVQAIVGEVDSPLRLTRIELEAHPRWDSLSQYAKKVPLQWGYLAIPLTGRNGINIGSLQLAGKYEGEFTQIDEYVATQLAQLASIAIDNVTLLDEIKELNSGLEDKVALRTSELSNQEALFKTLAEQAPQPIWTVDIRGALTFASQAYYRFAGGVSSDWYGYKWLDLVHPDDIDGMSQNWLACSKALTHFNGTRRMLSREGTYRTMSYQASPVFDENHEVIYWVGIDTDITDIKAIEIALRQTNRELESFSYSVSHDLRMPLNTIEGFSQLLIKELKEADGNGRRYIDRIQYGVRQMSQLIDGLLSLAQVARIDMRQERNDLSALALEILVSLQSAHPRRHVSYSVEPELKANGDSRLIRSVMENLLGNAWKFSSRRPHAEITVGHSISENAFFVRDNGAGFNMAFSDQLFGTFQRLHAAKEFPGTGIGLATVARIINRHGGVIWAESAPDKGATFFFRLPSSIV